MVDRTSATFAELLESDNFLGIVLSVAAVLIAVVHFLIKNRGVPPGPLGLPYIGFYPFLKTEGVERQLESLRKYYGDVFSFTVMGRLYINLPTTKLVREAHITKGDCFTSRVEDFSLLGYTFKEGVAFANGEQWKVSRKFFLPLLKDRSPLSNKENVYESMYDSMRATVEELRATNGQPVAMTGILVTKINTILRQLLFARSEVTEEKLKEVIDAYAVELSFMTATNLLLVGNFARYFVFPFLKNYKEAMRSHRLGEKLLFKIIDDHKSSYKADNMRDIIDYFIKERNDRQAKGDPTASQFTDQCLMASLYQFVGDGILSVAAFVSIYLKLMADNPEEQEKIYQEIVEVVGTERQPTMEDKSRLPYTNAFILELLRKSDFFPFFPSLQCTKETTIRGYRIPEGAITLMNIWSCQNDPEVYEEPEKFNPSRFLQKEGKPRPELPVTFGVGKRACMGESFTMAQVFLFLTTLVQNFKITYPGGFNNTYEFFNTDGLKVCAHPRIKTGN